MELLVIIGAIVFLGIWLGTVFFGPPYVPTLTSDLKHLFKKLAINKKDLVVDLGAGDGRVLAMAASHGARVAGIELNPFLVLITRLRLKRYDATISLGDMWHYDIPKGTTYVFVFPAGSFMNKLENYCEAQASRHGSFQLICYAFQLPGDRPRKVIGAFNLYQF